MEAAKRRMEALLQSVAVSRPVRQVKEPGWRRVPADEDLGVEEDLFDVPMSTTRAPYVAHRPATPLPERTSGYAIPTWQATSTARWVSPGELVEVAGIDIPGMVYVGQRNGFSQLGGASLIDPEKNVAEFGDYTYWPGIGKPSYESMPDASRRAYLDWLAHGRRDPRADLNYPLLFVMGLEHRVLVEADACQAAGEYQLLEAELRGLLPVYGGRSVLLRSAIEGLLERMQLQQHPHQLYARFAAGEMPYVPESMLARIALAQAAADGVPIHADLAFAWVTGHVAVSLRAPMTRCPQLVRKSFARLFDKHHPRGLTLRPGRYPVEARYVPASLHLGSYGRTPKAVSELRHPVPDEKHLLGLQGLLGLAQDELEHYSRFVGRFPDQAGTMAAALLVPVALWEPSVRAPWDALHRQVEASGVVKASYAELLSFIGVKDIPEAAHRTVALGLAQVFEAWELRVACGADIRNLAPSPEVKVALSVPVREAYPLSLLTTVARSAHAMLLEACADADQASRTLEQLALGWTAASAVQGIKDALHCELAVLGHPTLDLKAVKKEAAQHPLAWRAWSVKALAHASSFFGAASPATVKLLLKLAKSTSCDSAVVYEGLQGGNPPPAPKMAPGAEPLRDDSPGLLLDEERIDSLHAETQKVDTLLGNIFSGEPEQPLAEVASGKTPEPPAAADVAQPPETDPAHAAPSERVLGLNLKLSELVKTLISKKSWGRAEVAALTRPLGLMLDGAVESLNEAAFDAIDAPFFDSEEPFELNPDIVEYLKK